MTGVLEHRRRPIPVRAVRAGRVDAQDPPVPRAEPVSARRPDGVPTGGPRAWFAGAQDAPPGMWRRHAECFDRTGLWPLLSCSPGHLLLDDRQPADAEPTDAAEVLARTWEGARLLAADGPSWPQPPWPGLAAPSGEAAGTVVLPDLPWAHGDLLLVPVTRPADAVARLGWQGAWSRSLRPADVAGVLRSWEDRFGAYLVAIGPEDLDLLVTRPPLTAAQCRVLAEEHLAFCPGVVLGSDPAEHDARGPERWARALRGALTWHFWWE